MRRVHSRWLSLCVVAPICAAAQDFAVHGQLDVRLVAAPDAPNWTSGGLGKLRWDGGGARGEFAGIALLATAQVTPEWLGLASVQVQTTDASTVDLLEAWVRYRPVSTTPRRWSLRLGTFFPAISLENSAVGWSSPHTLTPSAINSWVGEELRSTGAEFRIEHRGDAHTLEAAIALFGRNDPAGEQLAARGWSLSDLAYGLGSSMREPDVAARSPPPPRRFDPFVEVDDRIGWHADATWRTPRHRITVLRYDNRADPATSYIYDGQRIGSWRTRFWSIAAQTQAGDWIVAAQAMDGNTLIVPSPAFRTDTDYWAAYVLVARDAGAWRPALRADVFGTRQGPATLASRANEHGHAWTLALNWRPHERLRIVAEAIALDSARTQRRRTGDDERERELQVQLGLRWLF